MEPKHTDALNSPSVLPLANTTSFFYKNYILLIMLLQLSWFFLFEPLHPAPLTPSGNSPHHCSCLWVMPISSLASPFPILYFTSPWLFCNYLFVLNSLICSPTLHLPPPIWQPSKCSQYPDSVSVLLVCLDSIIERYVFFWHLIDHSFDLLLFLK